jgi:hypothetical protein
MNSLLKLLPFTSHGRITRHCRQKNTLCCNLQ